MKRRAAVALLAFVALGCRAGTASPYETIDPHAADGTGKRYLGREIARVASDTVWLERPSREQEERPDLLVAELRLRPDMVVADVGAGAGYLTFRIAKLVPRGRVYAVDVDRGSVANLLSRRDDAGAANVEPILGDERDPRLPRGAVDLALLVDVYHELAFPKETMAAVVASLRPGGQVVLVEYRGEDAALAIKPLHKMTVAQAERELQAAGLHLVRRSEALPTQHLLVFER